MNKKRLHLRAFPDPEASPGSESAVRIDFQREGFFVEVPAGTGLLEVIRNAGIAIETLCNGMGTCGKCLVRVDGQPVRACACSVTENICVETPPSPDKTASVNTKALPNTRKEPGKSLGLAVDLGTTGISACLADMETGDVLAEASCLNPQVAYGADVLTRAAWCRTAPENVEMLRKLAVNALNGLIQEMAPAVGREAIRRVTAAGNTVMQHIFAGVDPSPLAHFPFRPVFTESRDVPPGGLNIAADACVTLMPCASAFLGGDVVAGVAASGFTRGEKDALFIDIGTNGEIVLRLNNRLYGTSTAAGPAFEGMNISCGMRAVPGAVDRVFIDEQGAVAFTTMGGRPPSGICGSGLIDLTAVLLRLGLTDETGYLDSPDGKYRLTENIFLTQQDIRQVQLAKGAIAGGIEMLLREAGGRCDTLGEICIAGAFGSRLDFENLKTVGIIDTAFRGNPRFAGNTSLAGALLCLLDEDAPGEMSEVARAIQTVDLSGSAEFQEVFIRKLSFSGSFSEQEEKA